MSTAQQSEHSHAHGQEGHAHSHVHEQGSHAHSHAHAQESPAHSHGTNNGVHTHVLEDGTVIEHSHTHGHTHTHQNTKSVVNRLARAIGHLEKVKNMVEAGEDCSEVLVQLSAVRSALNNTGKLILKDHMEHCLVDAVQSGDLEEIADLTKAIDQFIK